MTSAGWAVRTACSGVLALVALCGADLSAGPDVSLTQGAASGASGRMRVFHRIDLSKDEDRVHLQGAFYPPWNPKPQTSPRTVVAWGDGDYLQAWGRFAGAWIDVSVLPALPNVLRFRVMCESECVLTAFVSDAGHAKQYFIAGHPTTDGPGLRASECVYSETMPAKEYRTVEVPLSVVQVAGRERVTLYLRPMEVPNPSKKADVTLRVQWVETLVPAGRPVDREIARWRAVERAKRQAERFTVVMDSTVEPHYPFNMTIVARTGAGYPDPSFRGELELTSNSPHLVVPSRVVFKGSDSGVKRLTGLTCAREGSYFVRAALRGRPEHSWRSNYVICRSAAPYRIVWGDLHVHTHLSDGYRSPDYAYRFARDVSHLNFLGINDHDTWRTRAFWETQQQKAAEYNDPPRFVTILGFEWTSPIGHRNVWFPGDRVPTRYEPSPNPLDRPVSDLIGWIRDFGGILSPHHLMWACDFSDWTAATEPVLEIHSQWGSSERLGDPVQSSLAHTGSLQGSRGFTAVDLLNRGLRFGFVGGSDTHLTAPGANVSQAWWAGVCPSRRPGIAALFVKELTREGILEALRNRRCYATMNERIVLDFSMNGRMMGEETDLAEGPVILRVRAWGTAPIANVQIVRNGEVIYSHLGWGESDRADFEFRDPRPLPGTAHYYVRVQQIMGGEYVNAWSSPIWVTRPLEPSNPPNPSRPTEAKEASH